MWNGTPSLRVVNPMCSTCDHTLKSHEESHCFMLLSSTNDLHMKTAQRIEPACHKGGVRHEMRNLPSYICWPVIRNSQVQAFLMEPPWLPVPTPTTRGYLPLKVQTNTTWLPKYYAPFKASPNQALQSANIAANWSKRNPSSIKWGPISNYILRKEIIHHQLRHIQIWQKLQHCHIILTWGAASKTVNFLLRFSSSSSMAATLPHLFNKQ